MHGFVHAKSLQSCPTLCNPMNCSPPSSSVHGDSPGKTWVGWHALLQGIFPSQGLNLHLLCPLHWQAGSLPLAPPGKPKYIHVKVKVKLLSRAGLCDPMDCSLSGSSVHGIFQASVLEWIAVSFSRGSSWPRNRTQVSRIAGRLYRLSHQGSPKYIHKYIHKNKVTTEVEYI